jgi:hypothetical protein
MATLQRGSLGPDVERVQQRLNDLGTVPLLVVDGVFGPLTEAAVIAFQSTHELEPDGIVGPLTNAALFPEQEHVHESIPADVATRIRQVMDLLVNVHGFPANGAAGIVGNLQAESGVMPNRIEGSRPETPLRAPNFAGGVSDFSALEVMNRNRATGVGPRLPGIGLAQWTSALRRARLFQHVFEGVAHGADILFHMEAQVDYLANELAASFPHVNALLRRGDVSVNDACDEVAYRFEVPGVVLDENGHLLPRSHPRVQGLFNARRPMAQRALQVFESVPA